MKRAVHDFLLSPRDFLLGALLAIVGLIYGLAVVAFWLDVGGLVLYYGLIPALWEALSAFGQWLWSLFLPG